VAHRKALAVVAAVAATAVVALTPSRADARPIGRFRGGVVIGGYYSPFFYSPFYSPFGWGYGWGPYGYGYGYRPYGVYGYDYGYGRYGYARETASARVLVTPKDAEVYVDGYRAGRVDDFDGTFQRLHVTPGPHDITLYLNGYRTINEKVYFGSDSTIKIRETMARLAPGETSERPPAPAARTRPRRSDRPDRDRTDDSGYDMQYDAPAGH